MYIKFSALEAGYIERMRAISAVPDPAGSDQPLAGFSQCHADILLQLQVFAELPELQATAAHAREVAANTLGLFKVAVYAHHADEERELFPAVLRSAAPGEEASHIGALVQRLTDDHRSIESRWKKLEPAIRATAKGKPASLDSDAVEELVAAYRAHARFEEQEFLPLAERVLDRNSNHMAALGLSLHLRHARPVLGHV